MQGWNTQGWNMQLLNTHTINQKPIVWLTFIKHSRRHNFQPSKSNPAVAPSTHLPVLYTSIDPTSEALISQYRINLDWAASPSGDESTIVPSRSETNINGARRARGKGRNRPEVSL